MDKKRYLFFGLGFIFLLFLAGPSYSTHLYSIPRSVQYSFTLRNRTNRIIEKAALWTYSPVRKTSTQIVKDLKASHPYELIEDVLGNQILHFTFENFPPFATKVVTIRVNLLLSDTPNPLSEKETRAYLWKAPYMKSDSPEIITLAKRLKAKNTFETAKAIHQWIIDNLEYSGYAPGFKDATYALNHKEGDCTEFMGLFVALARANGILARGIGGYICHGNGILKPYDYHNWAEFYDNGVWQIADPQMDAFMKNPSHYIAMQIIDESFNNPMGEFNRFRFEGEGLAVNMNK